MDVNEIKALISPNRPGGVSATELDRACRMLDEFDGFTREAVAGLVDISRRERARAEAAEARTAKIVALLGDVEKRVMPGKSNMEWLAKVQEWRDAS